MSEHEPNDLFDLADESDERRNLPDSEAIEFEFAPAAVDRLDIVAPANEVSPGVAASEAGQTAPLTDDSIIGRDSQNLPESDIGVAGSAPDEATAPQRRFSSQQEAIEEADPIGAGKTPARSSDNQSDNVDQQAPEDLSASVAGPSLQPDVPADEVPPTGIGSALDIPTEGSPSRSDSNISGVGELSEPNLAPTDIGVTGGAVDENSGAGTVVANLNTVDENAADTFSYAITDDASGAFEVVGTEIRVKAGANLDYETAQTHDITVQVTDAGGLTHSETFTIAVNDVNEAPVDLTVRGGSVAENAVQGTVVATVSGVDADANEQFTYALVEDAGGRFTIDSATGEITVADPLGLDFEAQPTHELSVSVTDSAGNSHVDTVTVSLNDVAGERVFGDGRDNVILGDAGNDYLLGGDGADTLSGGAGADWLYGQNGDDRVSGGDGN
ncbi:MAG: cadherin domain-containing protein, partial [Hyphomicrobiaceae bacterium]